jgi:chromosome segregation ATPase
MKNHDDETASKAGEKPEVCTESAAVWRELLELREKSAAALTERDALIKGLRAEAEFFRGIAISNAEARAKAEALVKLRDDAIAFLRSELGELPQRERDLDAALDTARVELERVREELTRECARNERLAELVDRNRTDCADAESKLDGATDTIYALQEKIRRLEDAERERLDTWRNAVGAMVAASFQAGRGVGR